MDCNSDALLTRMNPFRTRDCVVVINIGRIGDLMAKTITRQPEKKFVVFLLLIRSRD